MALIACELKQVAKKFYEFFTTRIKPKALIAWEMMQKKDNTQANHYACDNNEVGIAWDIEPRTHWLRVSCSIDSIYWVDDTSG